MTALVEPQNLQAIRTANNNRFAAARLKTQIKYGEMTVADVLRNPPDFIQNCLLLDVLMWGRRFGKGKLRRIGQRALTDRVNLCLTVGGASEGTRLWLADELDYVAPKPKKERPARKPKPLLPEQSRELMAEIEKAPLTGHELAARFTWLTVNGIGNSLGRMRLRGYVARVGARGPWAVTVEGRKALEHDRGLAS